MIRIGIGIIIGVLGTYLYLNPDKSINDVVNIVKPEVNQAARTAQSTLLTLEELTR